MDDWTQRKAAYQQAMAEIEQRFGVAVVPVIEVERLGDAMLTRPKLQLRPIRGWTPPTGEVTS